MAALIHTATGGGSNGAAAPSVRVTIASGTSDLPRDLPPLKLESLQVTGDGALYSAFDPATHHYALTYSSPATLQGGRQQFSVTK